MNQSNLLTSVVVGLGEVAQGLINGYVTRDTFGIGDLFGSPLYSTGYRLGQFMRNRPKQIA